MQSLHIKKQKEVEIIRREKKVKRVERQIKIKKLSKINKFHLHLCENGFKNKK